MASESPNFRPNLKEQTELNAVDQIDQASILGRPSPVPQSFGIPTLSQCVKGVEWPKYAWWVANLSTGRNSPSLSYWEFNGAQHTQFVKTVLCATISLLVFFCYLLMRVVRLFLTMLLLMFAELLKLYIIFYIYMHACMHACLYVFSFPSYYLSKANIQTIKSVFYLVHFKHQSRLQYVMLHMNISRIQLSVPVFLMFRKLALRCCIPNNNFLSSVWSYLFDVLWKIAPVNNAISGG